MANNKHGSKQNAYEAAYTEGQDAFRAGKAADANPYKWAADLKNLFMGWNDGFQSAADEEQSRTKEMPGTTIESLINRRERA